MIRPSGGLVIRHSPSTCSRLNWRLNTPVPPTVKTPRGSTVPTGFAVSVTAPASVATVA